MNKIHRKGFFLVIFLLTTILLTRASINQEAETRISKISLDKHSIWENTNNECSADTEIDICSNFKFKLEYEIWNPNNTDYTYNSEIEINSSVSLLHSNINKSDYYISWDTDPYGIGEELVAKPGITDGIIGLSVTFNKYNISTLPDGDYTFYVILPAVGNQYPEQVNHERTISVENGEIMYDIPDRPEYWNENFSTSSTESNLGILTIITILVTLFTLNLITTRISSSQKKHAPLH